MNFVALDLSLLGVFLIFVVTFLIRNKKNLKKSGLLFLYRTKWGMNFIDKTAKNHPKTLRIFSHVAIWLGYILMVWMLWLFARIVWIYLFNPDIVRAIKIPPIAPLVPYLPQIFKLSFLPPFYFIYWIIIIAVIAIPHEFFHGIYMRLYGIKVKSTGFGFFPFFLPIFMAAFVEQDEKSMVKAKNREQRAVLAAGTFANFLTAILGLILIAIFFSFSFTASGVVFDDYAYNIVETSTITMLNGIALSNPIYQEISEIANSTSEKNVFKVNEQIYRGIRGASRDGSKLALYYDSPAINSELYGPITKINGIQVKDLDDFSEKMNSFSAGETITITTNIDNEETVYELILEENPSDGSGWIGISFFQQSSGVMTKFLTAASFYKDPHIFYQENFEGAQFIYDLLWWLIIICFSVALVNMLPMGIFDGGRFFYLTVLKITKSEKIAQKSFKGITWFLLALVLLIMIYWGKSFF